MLKIASRFWSPQITGRKIKDRQNAVVALIEEAERCLVRSEPAQAEALFRQAQERDGKETRLYPWDKAVEKRLTVGLAKASRLAKAHALAQAQEEGGLRKDSTSLAAAVAADADTGLT